MYFDKYEAELSTEVVEPTTDEYEKEKSEQYHVESRNRRITEWRDWNLYVDIDRFKKQLREIVV